MFLFCSISQIRTGAGNLRARGGLSRLHEKGRERRKGERSNFENDCSSDALATRCCARRHRAPPTGGGRQKFRRIRENGDVIFDKPSPKSGAIVKWGRYPLESRLPQNQAPSILADTIRSVYGRPRPRRPKITIARNLLPSKHWPLRCEPFCQLFELFGLLPRQLGYRPLPIGRRGSAGLRRIRKPGLSYRCQRAS